MRSLSSKNFAGPEAVMTAKLKWWLSLHPNLIDRALSSDIWHISVNSLKEDAVGYAIWEASKFDRAEDRFWLEARQNPAVKHMVEQCVEAWRSRPGERAVTGVRKFVKDSLIRLLARRARATGKLPARVSRKNAKVLKVGD